MVDCCDDDSDESWEVKSYHGPLEAMEAMECQADAECSDDTADNAASKADEAAENAAENAVEEFPLKENCLEKSADGMQDVVTDMVCLSEECEASEADSDVIIGDVTMGSTKAEAWRVQSAV